MKIRFFPFLFSFIEICKIAAAFDIGFISQTPMLNTFDLTPPQVSPIASSLQRVDVEYDPVRSAGAQIKIFDNSGTLHLREPNDFKELPIVQPYGANS
ncbi:uncharacterized protein LOC34620430 [Cyclospora cayetanensis]|uniref:Uncharacterized protein LOC34620430 n=1 Tax=Cyclospora cayetanensis TaxID=88456 RepID=A0A6P6S0C1_9EIME|nr:uncharacterized protein LOC34620430 [Cyclospora cayetanensis]